VPSPRRAVIQECLKPRVSIAAVRWRLAEETSNIPLTKYGRPEAAAWCIVGSHDRRELAARRRIHARVLSALNSRTGSRSGQLARGMPVVWEQFVDAAVQLRGQSGQAKRAVIRRWAKQGRAMYACRVRAESVLRRFRVPGQSSDLWDRRTATGRPARPFGPPDQRLTAARSQSLPTQPRRCCGP